MRPNESEVTIMRKLFSPLTGKLILMFLAASSSRIALAQENPFYSVEAVVSGISQSDLGNHRELDIEGPSALYHWISLKSLFRLFQDSTQPTQMPLKSLGKDEYGTILSVGAPAFKNVAGIFGWHNPVGATVGGTGEIYGNHEAVLAFKISPQARIGLVVTTEDSRSTDKLNDPALKTMYDLILHVNRQLFNGKFSAGYIEWALINPAIVTSYSVDPSETISIISKFKAALINFKKPKIKKNLAPIEIIAGPQHTGLLAYTINAAEMDSLSEKLMANAKKLTKRFGNGWHSFSPNKMSCPSLFTH